MNKYSPGAQIEQSPWPPTKRPLDYVFILLLLAAVFFTIFALAIAIAAIIPGRLNFLPKIDFPIIGGLSANAVLLAAGVLILLAILFYFLARLRIRSNAAFQFMSGCPCCKQHDLIRVRRSHGQRILAAVSRLPVRSYACRNCAWNGVLFFDMPSDVAGPVSIMPPQNADQTDGFSETVVDPRDIAATAEKEINAIADPSSELQLALDPGESSVPARSLDASPPEPSEELGQTAIEDAEEESDLESEDPVLGPAQVAGLGASSLVKLQKHSPPAEDADPGEEDYLAHEATIPSSSESDEFVAGSPDEVTSPPSEVSESASDFGHGRRGFAADPLSVADVSGRDEGVPSRAVVIAPYGLSMRAAPDKRAEIVLSLEQDAVVEILDRDETDTPVSWHRVRHEDQVGWVSAAFLRYLHR